VPPGQFADHPYPTATNNYHHEVELVVAIGKSGSETAAASANEHVWGYAIGLDMTRRDLQTALKDKGRPWELGKSFDRSAPIGPLHPASAIGHPLSGRIWLTVNGLLKQQGDLADLIWSVPETIAHLSRYFELRPGDLDFHRHAGRCRPCGARGDQVSGGIEGIGEFSLRIV
jgi:fumarylpyruvate hydrolase